MGAEIRRGGEHDLHRLGPFLLLGFLVVGEHLAHVIGVGEGQVAFAGEYALGLAPVIARGLHRQVGLYPLQPLARCVLALVGDHRGEKAQIIRVVSRAHAELALPLGVGQLLIGDRLDGRAVNGGIDHARAHGEAEPLVSCITEIGGDLVQNGWRRHRLGKPAARRFHEAAHIGCEEQVCGAVAAFLGQPLDQAIVRKHGAHRNSGLGGEGLEQRVDQGRLAIGIDIHLALRRGLGQRQRRRVEGTGTSLRLCGGTTTCGNSWSIEA